ncbi:unnamed protein product, partial [Notodromas monacha]
RFYYEEGNQAGSFTPEQLSSIRSVSLARIICDNGDDIQALQPLVFFQPSNIQILLISNFLLNQKPKNAMQQLRHTKFGPDLVAIHHSTEPKTGLCSFLLPVLFASIFMDASRFFALFVRLRMWSVVVAGEKLGENPGGKLTRVSLVAGPLGFHKRSPNRRVSGKVLNLFLGAHGGQMRSAFVIPWGEGGWDVWGGGVLLQSKFLVYYNPVLGNRTSALPEQSKPLAYI